MNDTSTWKMGICPECTSMQEMQLCPVCGYCQHHCRELEGCPLRQAASESTAGTQMHHGKRMGGSEDQR